MTEPKFTPGPWNVSIESGDWGMPITHIVYVGETPFNREGEICSIYSNQPYCAGASEKDKQRYIEGKANAHLIAAAPELYEALSHLEPYLDAIICYASTIEEHPQNGYILETKAALAKARGEA